VYYSLDVKTMATELWSVLVEASPAADDCNGSASETRWAAAAVLLLVCAPVAAASVALYLIRDVPSMPLPAFLSATAAVVVTYVLIDPEAPDVDVVLKWWLTVVGLALLLLLAFLSLTKRTLSFVSTSEEVSSATMGWLSFTAGLSYAVGICWVVEIFSGWEDEWRWIVINIICFLPLIGTGLVLGEVFLINLGALGLIFDAIYISTKFPDDWIIVRFLFLALFGALIIALGIFLQRTSESIRKTVDEWAAGKLGGSRNRDNDVEPPKDTGDNIEEEEEEIENARLDYGTA